MLLSRVGDLNLCFQDPPGTDSINRWERTFVRALAYLIIATEKSHAICVLEKEPEKPLSVKLLLCQVRSFRYKSLRSTRREVPEQEKNRLCGLGRGSSSAFLCLSALFRACPQQKTNSSHSGTEGSQDRKAGKDTCRSGGELLTGLLPLPAQLPHLDNPGPRARGGCHHPQWARPSYINQQSGKMHQSCRSPV